MIMTTRHQFLILEGNCLKIRKVKIKLTIYVNLPQKTSELREMLVRLPTVMSKHQMKLMIYLNMKLLFLMKIQQKKSTVTYHVMMLRKKLHLKKMKRKKKIHHLIMKMDKHLKLLWIL